MADKATVIKDAQKYLAKGQIDKAIAEWEKLAREAPEANTYNSIGDLYLRKGDKRSAVENFHRAAKSFRAEGFSLKALALYRKIININPTDADSLIALGELSEEKGLVTDAIKYYLSAADILSKDAKKEGFLTIYEKILSLAPSNIPLRDKVAGLFLKEGLTSDAAREYLYIAKHHGERRDFQQAGDYFKKALAIQPDNRDALLGMSEASEKEGDIPSAVAFAKKALFAHPDNTETLERCVSLLKETGEYDEAIRYLSRVLESRPFDPEIHRLAGEVYLAAGDREKAWESYKTVIDSFTTDGRVREAIAIAGNFRDVDPVAIGKILISLYRQNNDAEAASAEMISVADLLSESGLKDEALTYYREALKINPDDVQLKKRLAEEEIGKGIEPSEFEREKTTEDLLEDADIFFKYGLYDEARPILENLKMREPENIAIHRRLKSLYLEIDDREQAVAECLILSELYTEEGDTENSETLIKEAIEINAQDPRLQELIAAKSFAAPAEPKESEGLPEASLDEYSEDMAEAEFYQRQGLSQDALRTYQKLLAIFPDNEELQKRIRSIQGEIFEPTAEREEGAAESEEEVQFEEALFPAIETVEVPEISEPQFDSDVLDIFEEFKKGLEEQLEEEDYETHYNLGIAYKEMGLLDDAIKEFQTSRKDNKCAVRSLSMLGICYMEKGMFPLAIEAFKDAVAGIDSRDESYWSAKYDLATAFEKSGNLRQAFEIYSEIYGRDSTFREVTEKVNKLRTMIDKADATPAEPKKKNRVSYL